MITGLETEYGIMVERGLSMDPVETSQLFFNLWRPTRLPSWEFATEQPSQDARGWLDLKTPLEAPESPTEAAAASPPLPPGPIPFGAPSPEISLLDRVNFSAMLPNGARFYIDHAHPEYSTPECASLRDLIASDVAGQTFLARVATQNSASLPEGGFFTLHRNNTDFLGASYGCHENYLIRAETYTALFGNRQHRIFTFLIPYLVTRQIFCGAGKVGAEGGGSIDYQISQRADFMETVLGIQTVWRRPIVNTRDEPHADGETYRRLHVIVGDSNMSEISTFLKVGVTQLVLQMLEADWAPFNLTLKDPVEAIRAVSRDLTCQQEVLHLEGNPKPVSSLSIQRRYLEEARAFLDKSGATPEQEEVWKTWQKVLDDLESNADDLGRTVDWVIKYRFLKVQREKRGLTWDAPLLKEMDVRYHGIQPERSLYHLLLKNGMVDRIVSDAEVEARLQTPPPGTRAELRALLMEALKPGVLAVNWDCITVFDIAKRELVRLRIPDPSQNGAEWRAALLASSDPLAFAASKCPVERFTLKHDNEPRTTAFSS